MNGDFKFVTDQDADSIIGSFYDEGYRGDELTALSNDALQNLEQIRSAPQPQGVLPALAKGYASNVTYPAGQMIGGVEAFTPEWLPGESGLDEMLRKTSEWVGSPIVDRWQHEVALTAQPDPSLFSPEGRRSIAAMVGQQIPLTQTTAGLGGIGSLLGGGVGMGIGGLAGAAIGGPTPDDLAWARLGGKIGEKVGRYILPYAGLASMESKGFLEAGRPYFDDDILESYSRKYGLGSGLIEYVQEAAMLGKYTRLGKKLSSVSAAALKPAARALGAHGLNTAFQGAEEWSQAKLFNHFLDEAVKEQNIRNEARGLPLVNTDEIEGIKESVSRAFKSGAYVYNAIIAPSGVARGARSVAARGALRSVKKDVGKKVLRDIQEGKSLEEVAGMKKPKVSMEPVGTTQRKKEAKVPFRKWTPEQQRDAVENLPQQNTVLLATKMGIDVKGRGANTLVNDILQRVGGFIEGPIVMPEEAQAEPQTPGGYRKRGIQSARKMRQEEPGGSLANYGEREQVEWLGGKKPRADGKLVLYRATPTGEEIGPGDYVTNDRQYAQLHIESNLAGKGKISQTEATLDDIYPADGPKEFWYVPKSLETPPREQARPTARPAPAKVAAPETARAEDIPLGLERKPSIDPRLADMPDDQFFPLREKVGAELNALERDFDASPDRVDTDMDFRKRLAELQDRYDEVENEAWRREAEALPDESLIEELVWQHIDTPTGQMRAGIALDVMRKRGPTDKIKRGLQEFANRSPDHAELAALSLKQLEAKMAPTPKPEPAKTATPPREQARPAAEAEPAVEPPASIPGHRRIKYVKPSLNPVPTAEAERGKVIEAAHHKALTVGADLLKVSPNRVHWDRRRDALAQAVGWDAAVDMINKEDELDFSSVMTRDQYETYVNIMEGHVRDTVRTVSGLSMENAVIAGVERSMDHEVNRILNLKPIRLRDGTVFDVVGGVNQFEKIPLMNRLISPFFSIEDIAHRLNMPSLVHIDDALMRGKVMFEKALSSVSIARDHINSKLPKALRKGLGGKRMRSFTHWLMTDKTQKEVVAKQLGVANNTAAMAKWVAEGSTEKDVNKIRQLAADQVRDRRALYDWFVRNGIIHAERYRKNYAPVMYLYLKDSPSGDMTLSDWISRNREGDSMTAKLIQSLSDSDLKGLYDLTDTLASWEKDGYTTPGENPAFMEYVRKMDKEIAKTMAVATDVDYVFDVYTRRALQRMVFGDIAPSIASAMLQLNEITSGSSRDTVQMVFSHYLNTIAGMPDFNAKVLQETKILPGTAVKSSIVALNRLISKYNRLPFMPKIELRDPEKGDVSLQDAMNTTMTLTYASYLGIPNFTSPVKNLTQSAVSIALVGFPAFTEGLLNFKKNMKELSEMGLRPEYARFEVPLEKGKGKRVQKFAKAWMALYRMSDMTNVYGVASAGLTQWNKLLPDRMTDFEIMSTLFPGSKVKVDDKEVMKKGVKTNLKVKTISRPLATEVIELIRSGKEEDAKHLYLQYLVNLSQWRYGAGGTPRYLRNPLMKFMFMFSSWPANYVAFLRMMNRRGAVNLRADMRLAAAQILFASAAAAFGYNSWRWILLGPLPEDLIPFGPIGEAVINMYKAIISGSQAGTSLLLPFASDEERERARRQYQADLNALRGNIEEYAPWD